MQYMVSIDKNGSLALPSPILEQLGLTSGRFLTIEITPESELLLRLVPPTEIYTDERIAEFLSQEEEIEHLLKERGYALV